ncbi:MAG: helix-turn-helix domain-containing protein [Erysipelotrichaceae bacterium]
MIQTCIDEFESLDLPFSTFICTFLDHETESHDEMEFIWVIEGNVTIVCEKKTFELSSDNVFMIYINQAHSIQSTPNSLMFCFRLKKQYILDHHLRFDKLPSPNRIFSFQELAQKYHAVPLIISQIILLLKTQNPNPNIRYKLIGYYNMYIYDLYSVRLKERYLDVKKKNYDIYLIRFHTVIDYINKNFKQPISLNTLADLAQISPFRLSHFIQDRLGISFQEYLQNIRFEYALKELKNTNLPISEIVINSGFSDPKYLNRLMKKKFHVTALKYRTLMKINENKDVYQFNYPKLLEELSVRLHQIDKGIYMHDTFGLKENVTNFHDV